jgi:hypothetical protein
MSQQEHKTRRLAARVTENDKRALDAIACSGVVTLDGSGQPGLETADKISVYRVARLVELGVLIPNNDGLFYWCPQSYRVAEDAPPGETSETSRL